MSEKIHATPAEKQRAYRARQKEKAAGGSMFPLMPRTERAELRAALLSAADALEAVAANPLKGRRARMVGVMVETPKEAARRRADSIRNLVEILQI